MQILYRLARRDDPNHTLHGTYTGLWEDMPNLVP